MNMDNILETILTRYKKLENYTYIENENISNTPLGSHVYYISTTNLICKSGILISIKCNSIFELMNMYRNRKWYIYTNKNYIFYKVPVRNKFKSILLNLVNSDFKLLKVNNTKKNKENIEHNIEQNIEQNIEENIEENIE